MANVGICHRCEKEKALSSIDPDDPVKRICKSCWQKQHNEKSYGIAPTGGN